MIEETKAYCGVDTEEAFRILISGIFDVYDDRKFRSGWIRKMFTLLDISKYEEDPYRKAVKLPSLSDGEWEITNDSYKPYELFVYNDPVKEKDGRILPSVGYFDREYTFPAVKQNGRLWMLITPNEIETMKRPIEAAHGRVVTYGLGLGYFAFMASLKENVETVTVVERDEGVIRLFKNHVLPQFPNKEKIKIVQADALEYAKNLSGCDFVFADIWHDPSDGCSLYLALRSLEKDCIEYHYWIEDTLKLYL